MSFQLLPTDITTEFLSFCDIETLLNFQKTSRENYEIITKHDFIFKTFTQHFKTDFLITEEKPQHVSFKEWYQICKRCIYSWDKSLSSDIYLLENNKLTAKHNCTSNGDYIARVSQIHSNGIHYCEFQVEICKSQGDNVSTDLF
jgi:excinuclease UvrABC ATPase subunit